MDVLGVGLDHTLMSFACVLVDVWVLVVLLPLILLV